MVLTKFEFISGAQITNACHLLFPENDVFAATIELGRFSTPTSIKDGLTIRTDLFSEVEEIIEFIKKHINKSYIITENPRREELAISFTGYQRDIDQYGHRDYTLF